MRITKILNNNLVLAKDNKNEDIIVKGKGIGFHFKKGEEINPLQIEKIFYPENTQNSVEIQKYLLSIPYDILDFVHKYIDNVKNKFNLKLNNSIYISLSDHIFGTINRFKKGINLKNVLLMDIKQFYTKEYEISIDMLEKINEIFNVNLQEDEAGFIALHFVNAQEGNEKNDNYKILNIINDIQEIVKKYYKEIIFDENSFYYQRFLTHLKYFAQRYLHKELKYDNDKKLFDIICKQYKEAYGCVKMIYIMMQENYGYELSEEEMMYLTIHIQTNVEKSTKI
ncbi:BglG family transcription antiterminator LicT [[Clostridium] colinum]|uniref:BglG family transcription antiterminator LicT n=1 Tax=[Clostridium] colinum TaxID=36835 RepID=UPI002023D497|nr:PRD domain-containing protein [[Clostridium] colinum]